MLTHGAPLAAGAAPSAAPTLLPYTHAISLGIACPHPRLQVLSSGEEVKLQRNALEVLERPTGNELVSALPGGAVPPMSQCSKCGGRVDHFALLRVKETV